MAGGGAVAGAIIAAKQARIQQVVDAFRLGDATAPDRARRFEELGIIPNAESHDMVVEGVLVPGPREGTYYLSEAGYIYRRNDRKGVKAMMAVAIILLLIGFFFAASAGGP